MKKFSIALFILFLIGCRQEIINISVAKKLVSDYYESGQYEKETGEIIDEAIADLSDTDWSMQNAAIFDVDETALSNYGYVEKYDFGYNHQAWVDWINSESAEKIDEVKRFYDWLLAKNVRIIFLTGRMESTCEATKNNLIKAGYTKFDTLICRSKEERQVSAGEYKFYHRKRIEDEGYRIITNVGDQASDFEGGLNGYKITLPNYLYELD